MIRLSPIDLDDPKGFFQKTECRNNLFPINPHFVFKSLNMIIVSTTRQESFTANLFRCVDMNDLIVRKNLEQNLNLVQGTWKPIQKLRNSGMFMRQTIENNLIRDVVRSIETVFNAILHLFPDVTVFLLFFAKNRARRNDIKLHTELEEILQKPAFAGTCPTN